MTLLWWVLLTTLLQLVLLPYHMLTQPHACTGSSDSCTPQTGNIRIGRLAVQGSSGHAGQHLQPWCLPADQKSTRTANVRCCANAGQARALSALGCKALRWHRSTAIPSVCGTSTDRYMHVRT